MRFAVALVSGLAAVVSSQSTTASADSATASAAACLKKCPAGDVNCQSHCITVPSPNEQQVNDTTKCAAACPQGKGSPEETQKFADCVQSCISKHYYVSSEGTPQATGGNGGNVGSAGASGAATATGTGVAPTNSGSSGSQTESAGASGSGSGSKTSSGAAATSTNAAPGMTFGSTGALLGALAAVFAL